MGYRGSSDSDDFAAGCLGTIIFVVAIVAFIFWEQMDSSTLGINGLGPDRQYDVTVIEKHIDAQKDSSSYMVTTDEQVFEVDNGPRLDIWNADVIYGNLIVGQRYCITARGNQVTDYWHQQYPYVLKAVPGGC